MMSGQALDLDTGALILRRPLHPPPERIRHELDSNPSTASQGHELPALRQAVTKAIQLQDALASVTVDLPQGQVVVQSTLSRAAVAQAITEEGYEVQN